MIKIMTDRNNIFLKEELRIYSIFELTNLVNMDFDLEGNEFIELNKLLKILGLVESGGQANMVITEGDVYVNEVQEFRKRKKLKKGDVVSFMGQSVKVTS